MGFYKTMIAGAALALSATAAHAASWQMATPYPESNFHTQNILKFVKDIDAATDGKLTINVHAAGSLIKHQEIKNAVRSQQVEIGEFIISNLANENPIFALDSVPFVAVSYDDSLKMYRASKPALEEELGRQNLKVLFSVPWPPQGLYTDRPIEKIEDLKGIKMRAYSPQTERLAQLAGAVPTQVEVPDLAQAFTTGRVNAMITSTSTGVNTTAWDYLTHFYDVAAFLPKNIVVVNKRVFDGLDESTQKAVLDAAAAAEKRGWEMSEADHSAQRKVLEENGIKVGNGSDALNASLKEIGKKMADDWGKEAGEKGAEILKAYQAQ
ncbi:TRAP transporter substrate-binding protein [Pusillimonas sp. MFBS29]|uniref:TRAP transporter substrate-binding protein n=1 Tax=Pusillimonas sp. MFBS29 TaxID=2886690 RepID=UPI001D0F6A1C|nr:TRAP transporter substrate-binding protein [Pusillimonas sp. MFBS29]MCC2597176.1 TRAP transporter substrate-binding protein [Pusillimonas sp. MFBS29]